MAKGNDVKETPIVKIPGISAKTLKILIGGLRELGKKIKDDTCKEGIENTLRTISSGQLPLSSTEVFLDSVVGESPSSAICFALNFNDLSALEELRKADVPKEAIDFVKNLTLKYGFFFAGFKLNLAYPNDPYRTHWDHYYDVDDQELVLRTEILKRNREVILIEGPISSYLWLIERILEHVAETSAEAKKAIPKLATTFEKSQISKIRKNIEKIEAVFREHPAKPETASKVSSK